VASSGAGPTVLARYTEGMMTPLEAAAVTMNEFYRALMRAGFTDAQAIYLTGQRMNADARHE
jgi:hypothetical protein